MTPARLRRVRAAAFAAALLVSAGAAAARELVVCADPSNLPYSNARGEGFENRIAQLLAKDLQWDLRYVWNMQRRSFLRRTLFSGACDVVMGVPSGLPGVSAARPYYRSTYVFVTLRERALQLHDLDDPRLRRLSVGLQAIGAEGANTPPAMALAHRGVVDHIVGFPMWAEEAVESPPARIVDAVAAGEIDTAIVWGPFAGYFALRHGDRLAVTPVAPDRQAPALDFAFDMSIGVRKGDDALKARLQDVLDRRQGEIREILNAYGVPLVEAAGERPLPPPSS